MHDFMDSVAVMEKKAKLIPWERIQNLMGASGMTQAALARRLNVATNVVTNWKKRGGAPFSRADDLGVALCVPIERVIGEGVAPKRELSQAAQRVTDRLSELDRRGRITSDVETAVQAIFDLVDNRRGPAR